MATMFETTEVRWFWSNDDGRTERVRSWMLGTVAREAGLHQAAPQMRTDLYLVPCSPLLGVKQRGGGVLELKLRISSGRLPPIGAISGRLEQWGKVQASDVESLGVPIGCGWASVGKRRWLVRLDAVTSRPLSPGDIAEAVCGVELTELVDRDQVTLGFEAFAPDPDARRRALDVALRRMAQEMPELVLGEAESRGYPEWLANVRARP